MVIPGSILLNAEIRLTMAARASRAVGVEVPGFVPMAADASPAEMTSASGTKLCTRKTRIVPPPATSLASGVRASMLQLRCNQERRRDEEFIKPHASRDRLSWL
jgi:hypothetical protein